MRLKIRRLENQLSEKETEIIRLKNQKSHSQSHSMLDMARDRSSEVERYRAAQLQAEKMLDAREQSHRQQIGRLENQVLSFSLNPLRGNYQACTPYQSDIFKWFRTGLPCVQPPPPKKKDNISYTKGDKKASFPRVWFTVRDEVSKTEPKAKADCELKPSFAITQGPEKSWHPWCTPYFFIRSV